jgi:hypothetical protein
VEAIWDDSRLSGLSHCQSDMWMAARDPDCLDARSSFREGGRPGDRSQIPVWEGVPAGGEGVSTYCDCRERVGGLGQAVGDVDVVFVSVKNLEVEFRD